MDVDDLAPATPCEPEKTWTWCSSTPVWQGDAGSPGVMSLPPPQCRPAPPESPSSALPHVTWCRHRILLESWAIAVLIRKTVSFAEMTTVLAQMEDFDLSIRDFWSFC